LIIVVVQFFLHIPKNNLLCTIKDKKKYKNILMLIGEDKKREEIKKKIYKKIKM